MNAAEQAQWLCRDDPYRVTDRCKMIFGPSQTAASSPSTKPSNWNLLNAFEQGYWRDHGTLPPGMVTSGAWSRPTAHTATASTGCGRACGQPWTAEDYAASQREIDRLQREIDRLDSLIAATPRVSSPPRRLTPYVPPSPDRGVSATSNRIGPFNYYNDTNGVTGTSNSIGPFTYYNFSNGVSGTANSIGPFTYYNLNDNNGQSRNGTSTTIGPFQYHNFSNGVNGTSQQIGPFTYHNFSNGTNCTTQTIGTFVYTNCY